MKFTMLNRVATVLFLAASLASCTTPTPPVLEYVCNDNSTQLFTRVSAAQVRVNAEDFYGETRKEGYWFGVSSKNNSATVSQNLLIVTKDDNTTLTCFLK